MFLVTHYTTVTWVYQLYRLPYLLVLTHSSGGRQVPQQEETGNGDVPGDKSMAPLQDQSTARPSELVVSSSSSTVSTIARNLVGMPTLCTGKTKEQHNHDSDDEDSKERKHKAMDRLRKVSTNNCLFHCAAYNICEDLLTKVTRKIVYIPFNLC